MPKLLVPLVLLLLCVAFFIWWILTAKAFDRAIQGLHETNREGWHRLGRPVGFFWWPDREEKATFFQSTNARNTLIFMFIFRRREFFRKIGAPPQNEVR
jgi:hypothetical protein